MEFGSVHGLGRYGRSTPRQVGDVGGLATHGTKMTDDDNATVTLTGGGAEFATPVTIPIAG